MFANEGAYDAIIGPLASQYGVPVELVKGIIATESQFRPNAKNLTGADLKRGGSWGLMQMSLETAQGMGYSGDGPGLLDPATNLALGVEFLSYGYHGDNGAAAAAYNGGRKQADGTYSDQEYVDHVLSAAEYFAGQAAARDVTAVAPDTSATDTSDGGGSITGPALAVLLIGAVVGALSYFFGRSR